MEKVYYREKTPSKSDENKILQSVKAENVNSSHLEKNKNHRLELDGHELLSVSGVKSVPTFGDKEIKIQLDGESLSVTGQNLEIKLLDLEKGQIVAKGYVTGLKYSSGNIEKGMLKRIFK